MGSLVLAVDDDVITLEMLKFRLESAGYRVRTARSGKEAVAITAAVTPHVVLLDAEMPELDGFQTLTVLRRNPRNQKVPVIMLTGLRTPETVQKARQLGVAGYVVKPFDAAVLTARIGHVLRAHA